MTDADADADEMEVLLEDLAEQRKQLLKFTVCGSGALLHGNPISYILKHNM